MNVENSKIQVTSDQVKVKTQNFIVQSITSSDPLLDVSSANGVTIGPSLSFTATEGIQVERELKTSQIMSSGGNDITIESLNGGLSFRANTTLLLESSQHSIEFLSGRNLTLNSLYGTVSIMIN
jgi:hypothetical protein